VTAKRKVAETDGKVTSGRDKRSETRRDSGERQSVNKQGRQSSGSSSD
jgi:hypothetical protein